MRWRVTDECAPHHHAQPVIEDVLAKARLGGATDASVLVVGESGTARNCSHRRT